MDKLKVPLPWRYERRDECWPWHHRIVAANGYAVAACFTERTAKHIVHCVNAVDKALEACRWVLAASRLDRKAREYARIGNVTMMIQFQRRCFALMNKAAEIAREALGMAERGDGDV